MKETKIQNNFQITVPREIINKFNLNIDDSLIWDTDGKDITIKVKKQKKLKNKRLHVVDDDEIDSIKIENQN